MFIKVSFLRRQGISRNANNQFGNPQYSLRYVIFQSSIHM